MSPRLRSPFSARGARGPTRRPRARTSPLVLLVVATATATGALAVAAPAAAQVPGLPAAPGAFVGAGLAVAGNAAVGSGRWSYGGALAWAPGSARVQLVGAAAATDPGAGYESPSTAYGARATVPVLTRGRFGVAAFVGGGWVRHTLTPLEGFEEEEPARVTVLQVPAGLAVGVRGAWLGGRGWALTAAPQYAWTRIGARVDEVDDVTSAGRLRASVLAEFALTRRIGFAVAVEGGARGDADRPSPAPTLVGAGLSLAIGGGG